MAKVRTTIRVNESSLELVRKSGVRNISTYTENLWLSDVKKTTNVTVKERAQLRDLHERLESIEGEWKTLVKKLGREA